MKAKRYMKPPSCRKPATVIVPYAGQALDGQRPTRTISEPPADLELFLMSHFRNRYALLSLVGEAGQKEATKEPGQ